MSLDSIDQKKLLTVASKETKLILSEIEKKFHNEDLYAFALCVDNDVTSLYSSFNTIQGLKEICDDNDEIYYYKWNPDEWKLSIDSVQHFLETNQILKSVRYSEISNSEFLTTKKNTIFTLSEAMSIARNSFGDYFKNTLFYVNINDAEEYEIDIMIDAVLKFNPKHKALEFQNEIK